MAQCPWLKNGCCKRGGMHQISGLQEVGVCYGRQVNGIRYTNCQYYVNPKTIYTGRTNSCPLCERSTNASGEYTARCRSNKQTNGGQHGHLVKENPQLAICYGKVVKGQKYTHCQYYYRGGNTVVREVNRKENNAKKKKEKLKIGVTRAAVILFFFWLICDMISRM